MAQQTSPRRGADDDYSLEAVPTEARKGFWSMFVVMMGFTFFSASMSVGAKLGNGLDLSGFIRAVVIGGIILGAFTGKDDIFYVMIVQGLAIPALIVLGANIWTTNNNFYNALNQKSEVLYSFKNGRMIAKATPAAREVLF